MGIPFLSPISGERDPPPARRVVMVRYPIPSPSWSTYSTSPPPCRAWCKRTRGVLLTRGYYGQEFDRSVRESMSQFQINKPANFIKYGSCKGPWVFFFFFLAKVSANYFQNDTFFCPLESLLWSGLLDDHFCGVELVSGRCQNKTRGLGVTTRSAHACNRGDHLWGVEGAEVGGVLCGFSDQERDRHCRPLCTIPKSS